MLSDNTFRKAAFGGFNRDDVMAYISDLKQAESKLTEEKSALQNEIEALKAENSSLSEQLKSEQDKYLEKLAAERTENSKETSVLKEQNNLLTEKIAYIQNEYEAKLAEKDELMNSKINAVREEYEEKMKNELLADRKAEEKIGTAMLDVRRYADMLLQETCNKIDKMSADADTAAAKTLSRVLDITSGIQAFSDKLNSVFADMISENENICKELTGFKGSLKLPFETASGKLEAEILNEV